MAFILGPFGKLIGIGLLIVAAYLGFIAWLSAHDANVLHGYVLEEVATTLKAQLAEAERQAHANRVVADAYQTQYRNVLDKINQQDAKDEADRKANEETNTARGRSRTLDDDDIRFLLRSRP